MGAHDHGPRRAHPTRRGISRVNPTRLRFDAGGRGVIIGVSSASWWPTWAGCRLAVFLDCSTSTTDMGQGGGGGEARQLALKLQGSRLKAPALPHGPRLPTPHGRPPSSPTILLPFYRLITHQQSRHPADTGVPTIAARLHTATTTITTPLLPTPDSCPHSVPVSAPFPR